METGCWAGKGMLPDLPILLISNDDYYEQLFIERQVQNIKVLCEPFHLKDLYATTSLLICKDRECVKPHL